METKCLNWPYINNSSQQIVVIYQRANKSSPVLQNFEGNIIMFN
jgi:hypothetical protein